jgi:hypothetical protein
MSVTIEICRSYRCKTELLYNSSLTILIFSAQYFQYFGIVHDSHWPEEATRTPSQLASIK